MLGVVPRAAVLPADLEFARARPDAELELLPIGLQHSKLAGKASPRLSKRGELSKELAMATVAASATMRTAPAVGAAARTGVPSGAPM